DPGPLSPYKWVGSDHLGANLLCTVTPLYGVQRQGREESIVIVYIIQICSAFNYSFGNTPINRRCIVKRTSTSRTGVSMAWISPPALINLLAMFRIPGAVERSDTVTEY